MSKHTDRNRTPLKDPKRKQKKKVTFKQAVDKIKKRNASGSSNSSDSYSHSSDSSSDSSSNSRGHSSRSSSNDSHSDSLERYRGGQLIEIGKALNNNNLRALSQPFIRNMSAYEQGRLRNEKTNFSVNQIKGSGGYIDSDIFPTASRKYNYGSDWDKHERRGGRYDKYGNDNSAIFDSERAGRNAAYNDFVTKNRAAKKLTVDRNAPHSVDNLRRTASRSPSSRGQGDYSEMESLMRLSGKEQKYGKNKKETFADIIKNHFNKNKITEHYISERDACTQHGTDGGCNEFLLTTLPNGSKYYYTVPNGQQNTTVQQRHNLENALTNQIRKDRQDAVYESDAKKSQSVDRRIERTSQFKQNPQILKQLSEAEIRAKIQNFENIKKAKQAAKEARNKQ